jgi:hypothetical protein
MPNLFPQQTAAAWKYAFVYLQNWEGKTSSWHLAVVFIADMETPLLVLYVHIDFFSSLCFGDTGAIGPGF